MSKYFFFGFAHPDPSGEKRITMGEDFRVEGGDKNGHELFAEVVQEFAEGVKRDGIHCAKSIMEDVLKKVKK